LALFADIVTVLARILELEKEIQDLVEGEADVKKREAIVAAIKARDLNTLSSLILG
jgi:hypothetical protein